MTTVGWIDPRLVERLVKDNTNDSLILQVSSMKELRRKEIVASGYRLLEILQPQGLLERAKSAWRPPAGLLLPVQTWSDFEETASKDAERPVRAAPSPRRKESVRRVEIPRMRRNTMD